jgi:cation:H+ antiporter
MIWLGLFTISSFFLFWSGSRLVKSLIKIGMFLGWREFVVAFFVMAIAGNVPNFFVGINSAINNIPELSFGEVVGGNLVDLTLAVGLAVLISGADLPVASRLIQTSSVFTVIIVSLPLVLTLDGVLGRGDGIVLITCFFFYIFWLFSKESRFVKKYKNLKTKNRKPLKERAIGFFAELAVSIFCLIILLLASRGIVESALGFSEVLGLSLPFIGIIIIGLGNALPETYFAIASARRGHTWLILGNLMGSMISCATLVIGVVALINPITIVDFSPFVIARIFLVLSAFFFLIFVKTGRKITKSEAVLLLAIYFIFLFTEIAFS